MLKIFGLKINIADFFTQLAHGTGVVLGVAGSLFAPQINTALTGVQGALTTAAQGSQSGGVVTIISVIISLISTVALLVHNAEQATQVNVPPAK